MPKLSTLKPSLTSLRPRVGATPASQAERSRHRDATQPWRKWYYSDRWAKLRIAVFVRDLFTCNECGKVDGNTSRLVAHHRKAHRGNVTLFWDMENLRTVCKGCHDTVIQARERADQITGDWS